MRKTRKRNGEVAARVEKVAKLTGFTRRYVMMVINGDRENEEVMRKYMFLAEGENKLLAAARNLVPF